jgi:hypothetical protein
VVVPLHALIDRTPSAQSPQKRIAFLAVLAALAFPCLRVWRSIRFTMI